MPRDALVRDSRGFLLAQRVLGVLILGVAHFWAARHGVHRSATGTLASAEWLCDSVSLGLESLVHAVLEAFCGVCG